MQDHHIVLVDLILQKGNVAGLYLHIRARNHDDAVFGAVFVGLNLHVADRRRGGIGDTDIRGVDTACANRFDQPFAEIVVADLTDHRDVSTKACCLHSLVGTFAAGCGGKPRTDDGFTGIAKPIGGDDQIHYQTADD